MSDSCWPFPPPSSTASSSSSPRMHHSALPPAFISSPPPPHHHQHHHHHHHHHHQQSTTPFMNHSGHSHVQQHFPGQNLDTALENSDWSPAQFPSMLSGYSCPEQDLDLHLSSQNQFDSGLNSVYDSFQPEVFHYPDPQCLQSNNVYSQSSTTATAAADMSQWGPMEPTTPQLQCSSLGFTSRDAALGSWSSTDYNFTSNTENFFQFYPNSYQENQSFLSPSTPGPSPHYPPFVTSPSTENNTERLGFQAFVDPGLFTVTAEIKKSQTDVIQEPPKQKKATRGRGGGAGRPRKSRVDKNKDKDSPVPLPASDASVAAVMPPSLPERPEEGAGLGLDQSGRSQYHSLMRVTADDRRSHYRPPPILCPVRAGAGLYCSVSSRGGKKSGPVSMETASLGTLTSGTITPCINVGRSFQAEIPPLRDRRHAHADSHNALLQWRPLKELELSANQQRVEALLKLARSSAVPGGGANPEDALLLLSENRGDFLLTVEKLLKFPKSANKKQAHERHSPILSDYM